MTSLVSTRGTNDTIDSTACMHACNYNSDEESNNEEGNEVDSNNCESPIAAAHTYKYSMLVCVYVHT